jgi:hypothetical protein
MPVLASAQLGNSIDAPHVEGSARLRVESPDAAMNSLPVGLKITRSTGEYVVATYRNVLIQRVNRASAEFLDAIQLAEEEVLASHPEGYGTVVMVEVSASLPPADVRRRSLELWKAKEHLILCQALVVEGEGFWASAMRGFMTGIYAVGRTRTPKKACPDEIEAATFVTQALGASAGDRSALEAVLTAVRRYTNAAA